MSIVALSNIVVIRIGTGSRYHSTSESRIWRFSVTDDPMEQVGKYENSCLILI